MTSVAFKHLLGVFVVTTVSIILLTLYIEEYPRSKVVSSFFGVRQTDEEENKTMTSRFIRHNNATESTTQWIGGGDVIHLAVVACEKKYRVDQAIVMLKSAVLFSHSPLVVYIFTDSHLEVHCRNQLESWPEEFRDRMSYNIYNATFPDAGNASSLWRKMFKSCATERLFFPTLLPDVDALIYVDTDTLFLSPVDELWSHFSRFNSTQIAAASTAREYPSYNDRRKKIPMYGEQKIGINSGVMLMNLTRIRATNFTSLIFQYLQTYGKWLQFGDQCLLNIYFHFHSHEMLKLSCQWNYCTDYCDTGHPRSSCKDAENDGVRLLHGNRGVFLSPAKPIFRGIFWALSQYDLKSKNIFKIWESADKYLETESQLSNCEKLKHIFYKHMKTFVHLSRHNAPKIHIENS